MKGEVEGRGVQPSSERVSARLTGSSWDKVACWTNLALEQNSLVLVLLPAQSLAGKSPGRCGLAWTPLQGQRSSSWRWLVSSAREKSFFWGKIWAGHLYGCQWLVSYYSCSIWWRHITVILRRLNLWADSPYQIQACLISTRDFLFLGPAKVCWVIWTAGTCPSIFPNQKL